MDISLQDQEKSSFRRIDWNFVVIIFGLNAIGLVNLFSATHSPNSIGIDSLFINQILWLMIGWSIFFIMTFIDYKIVSYLAYSAYGLNFLAVVYVSFFGRIALGAQRWIDLGFFRYQPSETMKLAVIVMLARIFSQRPLDQDGMGLKDLLLPICIFGVPFVFILKQPDLGTAMMIGFIAATLVLFMKVKKAMLITIISLGVVAIPVAWNYVLRDYQRSRIENFMNPGNDPLGSGYNSIQSKIAVGSGKIMGKGFLKGTQSQLEFLPERHTDFIFSVLSEEWGFVGSIMTLSVFVLLFVFGLRIAAGARDKFGSLLTVGVLSYLFWHMFVNVGMVIGILPIVGVPLPLLSYGGSSMLTTMLGLGIVSSVAYRRYLF